MGINHCISLFLMLLRLESTNRICSISCGECCFFDLCFLRLCPWVNCSWFWHSKREEGGYRKSTLLQAIQLTLNVLNKRRKPQNERRRKDSRIIGCYWDYRNIGCYSIFFLALLPAFIVYKRGRLPLYTFLSSCERTVALFNEIDPLTLSLRSSAMRASLKRRRISKTEGDGDQNSIT